MLQVCLTIQILGLDVSNTRWVGRLQEDQVRREVLVAIDLDDLADPELPPLVLDESLDFLTR